MIKIADKFQLLDLIKKWILAILTISIFLSPVWTLVLLFIYSTIYKLKYVTHKKLCIGSVTLFGLTLFFHVARGTLNAADIMAQYASYPNTLFLINSFRMSITTFAGAIYIYSLPLLSMSMADWQLTEEKKKREKGIPLGKFDFENRVNSLFVGTTRSGKTVSMLWLIEHSLKIQEPVIIISGKNGTKDEYSMLSQLKILCQKYGRKLYIVSTSPEEEMRVPYNPFAYASPTAIADALATMMDFSDTHYESNFKCWILGICSLLKYAELPISPYNLYRYFSFDAFSQKVESLFNSKSINKEQRHELLDNKSYALIAKDSRARLAKLIHGDGIGIVDEEDGISVTDAIREKNVMILDLDGLALPHFSKELATMTMADINYAIANEPDVHAKKLLVFDELSVFFNKLLPPIYSMAAGYGFQVVAGTQSLSDLDKESPSLAEELIENSHQFGFLLQNSATDCERTAAICGTQESIELTKKLNGIDYERTGSQKVVDVYRLHPNTIRNLKPLEMIYYAKNHVPDLCKIQWNYLDLTLNSPIKKTDK